MSHSFIRSEIQRLLAKIASLNEQYEKSVVNNEIFEAKTGIKTSIKKLQEQLEKMHEKLLGVSIE
ncbi:MAG: hypothetical protein JST09_02665 [Bacteroidetes bacterium]|nr:hypothetical protein [Bacteroidota bacterium]MBS1610023.1 hypothetical protein [Bacteroidota bacterium]